MSKRYAYIPAVCCALFLTFFTWGCNRETTAKEYYQKSFQFINAGSTKDAIDLLSLAIKKDPSFYEAYYNRGVMYYCQDKYQEALDDFNKAIDLRPDDATVYASRGTLYSKMNREALSLADLMTAARLGDMETREYLASTGVNWQKP